MRTIICKKCGAPIDADLGECPICGAVYYILPRDDEEDATRVWDDTAASISSAIVKETRQEEGSENDETIVMPAVAPAAEEPKAEPKPAPAPPRSKQRMEKRPPNRTWIYAGLAAALLAVLTVVMCFMTGVFDFGKNTETMPGLVGLNRDVAVNQLKALDLSPNLIYEESDEPEGTVIDQKPEEGKSITKRTGISLTISSGTSETPAPEAEFVEVPEVMGMSYDQAFAALSAAGLQVQKNEEYSTVTEVGHVMRQSPLSRAKVSPGETVTLTVSLGPEELEFTLVLTAGKGGSISPSGAVTVKEGDDLTITLTPDEGYEIKELRIDGESVGAPEEYTLEKIDGDHSVYAVFAAAAPEESPEPEATPEPVESARPASPSDIR